jgi:hypothetical protein
MKRSEQIGELVTALAKAQLEFTSAVKDSDNPYYNSKYADLNAVINAVRPALNKHGIAMMHNLESDLERQVAIVTVGLYCGEQFMEIEVEAPATGKGKKEADDMKAPTRFDVQTIGAAWTYLRRYSLQAICGLASEDDDGNALQGANKPIPRRFTPAQAVARENRSAPPPDYEPDLPSENVFQQPGASTANPPVQPSTGQPAGAQGASQSRIGPTKRIPPTPPDNLSGLLFTVKSLKEWPKKGTLNTCINVSFDAALDGKNQEHTWICAYATCWHEHLFNAVRASVGKEMMCAIKERDKKLKINDEWPTHFIDIENIWAIDGQLYEDGKPLIEGVK